MEMIAFYDCRFQSIFAIYCRLTINKQYIFQQLWLGSGDRQEEAPITNEG
jgi:hypothetical protein